MSARYFQLITIFGPQIALILYLFPLPYLPPHLFPPSLATYEKSGTVKIRKVNLLQKILGLIGLKRLLGPDSE